MNHKPRSHKDYPPAKTITFIGPDGKETWVGAVKGLKNMYPFAKVLKVV